MTKKYCDVCGTELTQPSFLCFERTFKDANGVEHNVFAHIKFTGKAYGGDLCRPCALDAIMALDDRKKQPTKGAKK